MYCEEKEKQEHMHVWANGLVTVGNNIVHVNLKKSIHTLCYDARNCFK